MAQISLFRSFRHRNYRLYFGGQLVSLTGTWMQATAQQWLVAKRLAGSPLQIGLVVSATTLPVFLFALFGGALADRFPKRKLLVAAQTLAMLQAAGLCLLTASGHIEIWHVMCFAACLGCVNAVEMPTRHAFAVEMVGKEDLHNAIALNSSLFHLGRVIGPALAGELVHLVGEAWCFGLNALSFLAVIAGLLAMRLTSVQPPPRQGNLGERLKEGLGYSWRNPLIRTILLLIAVSSLTGAAPLVLLPVFARDVFHVGSQEYGYLLTASGLGSLAGALFMGSRANPSGLRRIVLWGSLGLGIALACFAQAPLYWVAVALLIPVGFCFMVVMPGCNTMIQLAAPDAMRGRIMAVYSALFMGMNALGPLIAGGLAKWQGAPLAVTVMGLCCLAGALWPARAISRMQ